MIRNYIRDIVSDAIGDILGGDNLRRTTIMRARKYRSGFQPKKLRVKPPQSDDNIIVNVSGLVVERAVSLLMGKGVEFDLPGEGESEADTWLERVWELNKKSELLHDVADYGATSGTPTVLFDVDSIISDGQAWPSLSVLDPAYLTIETDPQNYKQVKRYIVRWELPKPGMGDKIQRRRLIEPNVATDAEGAYATTWTISDQELQGNQWINLPGFPKAWAYEWPPILAWKNLPNPGSPYGRPDLTDDVLDVQDGINLVASNINKVMRLQGHQRLWSKMFGKGSKVDIGPDALLNADDVNAELHAIEANSGFADMVVFLHELQDALFTIARSTDPHSLKDKIGEITNFGLRVLYKDALDKLETKRELYGEALKEINKRLLELGGFPTDPGEIIWEEPLPANETEQVGLYTFDLNNKIAARETIQRARGYDPETEDERIDNDKLLQKEQERQQENIGAALLKFNRGAGGQNVPPQKQKEPVNAKPSA